MFVCNLLISWCVQLCSSSHLLANDEITLLFYSRDVRRRNLKKRRIANALQVKQLRWDYFCHCSSWSSSYLFMFGRLLFGIVWGNEFLNLKSGSSSCVLIFWWFLSTIRQQLKKDITPLITLRHSSVMFELMFWN